MENCNVEQGLFYHRNLITGEFILVVLWVDKRKNVALSKQAEAVLRQLHKHYIMREVQDTLLGCGIKDTKEGIYLNHTAYIERKVEEFQIDTTRKYASPMDSKIELVSAVKSDDRPYSKLVGSLMHSMVALRADIAFAVGVFARFANAHDETHWEAGIRVLQYLYNTRDYTLGFVVESVENHVVKQGVKQGVKRLCGETVFDVVKEVFLL